MKMSFSSQRSLACIFSKPSFSSNRETLDYLLGASVFFERSGAFLFSTAFFVFLRNSGVNPELAGERNFIKSVPLLELLDITDIFVIESELLSSGYNTDDFVMPITILNEKIFYEYMRRYTDVIML